MGVILDSSVLIAAERERFDLPRLLQTHAEEVFQIAAITAAELLHGCARASDSAIRERRVNFVEGVIRDFAVAPFTLAEAREHAQLWAGLETEGRMIGPRDMEIAATALAFGFAVATLNFREFQRVGGLRLLDIAPYIRG